LLPALHVTIRLWVTVPCSFKCLRLVHRSGDLVWGVWCAIAADEDAGFLGSSGLERVGVAGFGVEGGGEDAGGACKEGQDESRFESELHFGLGMGKYWEVLRACLGIDIDCC